MKIFAAASLASFLALVASAAVVGCAGNAADTTGTVSASSEELIGAPVWQTLGGRQVDGQSDSDTIVVGADEGTFTAIKVRVQGSALLMRDIKVVFGNGETFSPNVSWFFDENTATRTIDLPGNQRTIARVEFKYGNLPGGGNASVQLLGKGSAPPPWQGLGQRQVNGLFGTDRIVVGADEGKVTAIKLRVEGRALLMFDVKVTFANGETFSPSTRLVFDENSASRVIDLPGEARVVQRVDFTYGNILGGSGTARVLLSGKTVAPPPWQSLGQREVDGQVDGDRIVVGTGEGLFHAIQIRVEDSALEMYDVKITFGNGEIFRPSTRFVFAEGTTTRVIDLPGDARFIKRVDFLYGNLPTGGDATVQLWGKR